MGGVVVKRRQVVAVVQALAVVALIGALIALWFGLLAVAAGLVGGVALALACALFVDLDGKPVGGSA